MTTTSRSAFLTGATTAAGAAALAGFAPARAAQFSYKLAHGTPTNFPVHVRLAELAATVRRQTAGRLDITIFPNNILGGELSQLQQLRSGALQFMIIQGVSLSSVVPGVGMDGVGFAFRDSAQAEHAFDGPLGAYLRDLVLNKGIFAFPRVFNFGMRQVTSSSHPIRTVSDFAGFKIRTPPAPISVDLFRSLGASPTPIVFPELYLALQTKIVDGQETPYSTIEATRFFEVQKYLSVTNHSATIFWFLANTDAWNALAPGDQQIMLRAADVAAVAQRRDTALQSAALAEKLGRLGMTFAQSDTASMRAQLKPFYAKWKSEFGATAWDLLEQSAGTLV